MNKERSYSQWAIYIQNQLKNHEESIRTIRRSDIKWPKGRKVSSHFAIESDTSSDFQQAEREQEVYSTSI